MASVMSNDINHQKSESSEMPKGTKKINDSLYIGPNFRIWQAAGEWKFKTFGRHVREIDGRSTNLSLAAGSVSSAIGVAR